MHLQSELHLKILPEKPLQPTRAMTFPSSSLFAAAEWGEKNSQSSLCGSDRARPPSTSVLLLLLLNPTSPASPSLLKFQPESCKKKVTLNRHYCSYIMWVVREPVTHISVYRPTLVLQSNLRTFTQVLYLREGLLLYFSRNFSILSHSLCPETLRLWMPKVFIYTVKSDKGTLL